MSDTLTVYEFPKENNWVPGIGSVETFKRMLVDAGGREIVFEQRHGCMIGTQQVCLFDHECQDVLVEVEHGQ